MPPAALPGLEARAAVLALAILIAGAPLAAQSPYLHVVPVEAPEGVPDPSGPVLLRLELDHPEELAEQIGGDVEDGAVSLRLDPQGLTRPEPPEGRLAATFVIDYDEEPVQELVAELLAKHPEPDVEALTRFTHDVITDKTSTWGFELPSRVAVRKAGDCTEHAVLLTALARAVGRPARFVDGIVLVWGEEGLEAFGHAWAEIHDGERWRRADATLLEEQGEVRYLPLFVLRNEGPGYGVERMESIKLRPRRIEVYPG